MRLSLKKIINFKEAIVCNSILHNYVYISHYHFYNIQIKVPVYFDIPRFSTLVPLFSFIAFPGSICSPLSSGQISD